jgi:hypothetical protein
MVLNHWDLMMINDFLRGPIFYLDIAGRKPNMMVFTFVGTGIDIRVNGKPTWSY